MSSKFTPSNSPTPDNTPHKETATGVPTGVDPANVRASDVGVDVKSDSPFEAADGKGTNRKTIFTAVTILLGLALAYIVVRSIYGLPHDAPAQSEGEVTESASTSVPNGAEEAEPGNNAVPVTLGSEDGEQKSLGNDATTPDNLTVTVKGGTLHDDGVTEFACADVVLTNNSDQVLPVNSYDWLGWGPGGFALDPTPSPIEGAVESQDVEPGATIEGRVCLPSQGPGEYALEYNDMSYGAEDARPVWKFQV